ncbi:hypothetical protein HPB47_021902, partial [Ixodes persulcatus]
FSSDPALPVQKHAQNLEKGQHLEPLQPGDTVHRTASSQKMAERSVATGNISSKLAKDMIQGQQKKTTTRIRKVMGDRSRLNQTVQMKRQRARKHRKLRRSRGPHHADLAEADSLHGD